MLQILLIDDEPSLRRVLTVFLERSGHKVRTASDGDEGLAATRDGALDLVLTDIHLPKRDGLSLLSVLRREAPDVDVILMTGDANVRDAVSAMKQGASDYLVKPFANEELLARIAMIEERRILRRELQVARAALSERLGPYVLEGRIGAGGMGVVYRANHAMLRRSTAVKLLRGDKLSDRAQAHFEREVRQTCRLTHPNTIAIYDYGRTPDGVFYYAMELLGGATVAEVVRTCGRLSPARTVHVLKQICGSLAEAHEKGIVHRDIKPSNIQLCERGGTYDWVKVLDFGLVKEIGVADGDMSGDMIAGTPSYLAPESIVDPTAATPLSDIYGLGALAYFMLTGVQPYTGGRPMDIMMRQLVGPPVPFLAHKVKVSPALEKLVFQCLEKDPQKRPPSMHTIWSELDAMRFRPKWGSEEARAFWSANEPTIVSLRENAAVPDAQKTQHLTQP